MSSIPENFEGNLTLGTLAGITEATPVKIRFTKARNTSFSIAVSTDPTGVVVVPVSGPFAEFFSTGVDYHVLALNPQTYKTLNWSHEGNEYDKLILSFIPCEASIASTDLSLTPKIVLC